MIRATAACLAALAGIASADSVIVTIDPGQSQINVDATLATPVGTDSDSGSTSVSGSFVVELDDYGAPASITLLDFVVVLDQNITLNFDYGFLGNASATLTDASAVYATPGTPLGPVGIAADAFAFPAVPALLEGTADSSYDFFLVGSGSETIVLADLGLFEAPIDGTVTSDGETVALAGNLAFDVTEPVLDGLANLTLTGTATIVASGPAPEPGGCNPADIAEPFGVLDLADINGFVGAFSSGDPAADIAEPFGVLDLADLNAFVVAFTAGCP